MKQIKRSELVNSGSSFIGYIVAKDFKANNLNDITEGFELLSAYKKNRELNDFIRSNLFDVNTNNSTQLECYQFEENFVQRFNEGENLNITPFETCRDGFFENDEEVKVYILEYEEIKEYYKLFKTLYEQEIYAPNREKDLLEMSLIKETFKKGNNKI